MKTTPAGYAAQLAYLLKVHDAIDTLSATVEHIQSIQRQLDERVSQTASASYATKVSDAAKALRAKLEAVRAELVEVNSHVDEITLIYPVKIYNQLLTLNAMAQMSDDPPTAGMVVSYDDLTKQMAVQREKLSGIEKAELAAFNGMMVELKATAVRSQNCGHESELRSGVQSPEGDSRNRR